jgi:hypothetical protein
MNIYLECSLPWYIQYKVCVAHYIVIWWMVIYANMTFHIYHKKTLYTLYSLSCSLHCHKRNKNLCQHHRWHISQENSMYSIKYELFNNFHRTHDNLGHHHCSHISQENPNIHDKLFHMSWKIMFHPLEKIYLSFLWKLFSVLEKMLVVLVENVLLLSSIMSLFLKK